jgi:tRNA (guanine37-N1)-methyltransferase
VRFDVITLFPTIFDPFLEQGVARRAFGSDLISVKLWNLRDFAQGNYKRVDDRPYGGGAGMVMMAEPLLKCMNAIREERAQSRAECPLIFFTPIGQTMTHELMNSWSSEQGAILLCGRYEGVDQRFIDLHVDQMLSLGDFVLSGGEIPAMAFLDGIARLQPGVLNTQESHELDSFNERLGGLLDCPHYTRPEVWEGLSVPSELMSGHHERIELWRKQQSELITAKYRPDILSRKKGGL